MARQYNLKNLNGLHLKAPYDYDSYNASGISALIENFDFYPLKTTDITTFNFINSTVRLVATDSIYYNRILGDGFTGDNLFTNRTHDLPYSEIKKTNELVKGEKYYTNFNFYFNFGGEDADGFDIGSTGYTITVSLYAILGNTKRKLKLSNLRIYNYKSPTYSGTKDNPVDAGYVPLSTTGYSLYNNNVSLSSDNINMSFYPRPKTYDIINNTNDMFSYTFNQGDSGQVNYGQFISASLAGPASARRISFQKPAWDLIGPGYTENIDYKIVDNGFDLTEEAPFDVMTGPLFRVTAQLDATSEAEFNANICTGNKDFKIMVDYNGKVSKTIITYEAVNVEVDLSVPVTLLPS
jgi:hypothetical protein